MSDLNSHPSREELSAYSLGQLPEEQAVAIDAHINECEPCCETIVELSSEDTFAGLLREAGRLPVEQTIDNIHRNAVQSTTGEDMPGELAVHPRYEVIRLIGKGGMGDVYKACHRKMERTVALKVINRGLFRKAEVIDRFHREVKAAAQLSHPNIVTAYDADQAGEFHFMVMEYVDGVDLARKIKDCGALPIAEACEYIRQAAIGLQHAHERGMVHRDIKPHNLMVTQDGTVKILDFGLASLAPEAIPASDAVAARSDLTAAGAIMGTPDFISPEQAEDARQADIRSDIYSLGATLYYLLSGRVPFDDGSVMHKLKSHAQVEPAPLNSVRDDVPQKLVAIASRMMAKDPDERYLTPKEVAEALESFLRTWRLGDAESRPHEPASGGNMSGSDVKTTGAGDMSRDWLSMLTRWLFWLSLVPIALLLLDAFVLSEDAGEAVTDRFLYYLLASVTLSSVAGVLSGIHQFKNGNRDDQSTYRLTTGQTLLIAAILAGSVLSYFKADIVRLLSTQTSGESDAPSAFMAQFRAAEKITDQDRHDRAFAALAKNAANAGDVLMTKRALEHIRKRELESPTRRDCSIALFKTGKHDDAHGIAESIYYQHDRDAAFAAFAGTGDAKSSVHDDTQIGGEFPTLQIMGVDEESNDLGNDVRKIWKLQGRRLDRLTARIVHISNGERQTVYRTEFRCDDRADSELSGELVLHSQDRQNDQVALSLDFSFGDKHGESDSQPVTFAKGFGRSSASSQTFWDGQHIDKDEVAFLLTRAQYPSKASQAIGHSMDDIESMQQASSQGAEFLLVLLFWEPVGNGIDVHGLNATPEANKGSVPGSRLETREESSDNSNIQGSWQVTYSEDGGKIAPQEMLKELRFVIDEQNLNTVIGGRKSFSTYTLDPSTNPKSLDLTENGRTKQGIYDLVGDTLRICIAESGDQRPTAFDSQPNSANDIVLILKRVKPEEASSADTDDHLHAGPMSPKLARSLIPAAASISNEDFQKLQTNPSRDALQNKSLSLILMALDVRDQSPEEASDFRFLVEGFPHPSEIAAAMSPSRSKGYYSIIQPDYITECQITTSTDEIARGRVTFNAPKLYIGSVTFESRKHEGTWRIEKFQLSSRQISIVLGEDGNWHRQSEGKD